MRAMFVTLNMRRCRVVGVLWLCVWAVVCRAAEPVPAERFAAADRLIGEAIASGQMPGAVLLVGRGDAVVYRKAYGHRALHPTREAMTVDTVFDLASLTKPVATAASVMKLVDAGVLGVDDKVATHIPEFAQHGKGDVTIAQLLLHRGGLTPDNHLRDYADGREEALRRIWALRFNYEPDARMRYSDVGFIVLGEVVRRVDPKGRSLDVFARDELFEPLKMADTRFSPPADWRPRIAPTAPSSKSADGHLRGVVHDPRASRMGGVAGHAGLFSTVDDLSRFCRMLIRGGELGGVRVLRDGTVRLMTAHRAFPEGGGRTYGFDADTSARGDRFAVGSTFGHTGFTGPMLWIDPVNEAYVILLCSRLHPDGKGNVIGLRRAVSTVCAEALLGKER